MLKEKETFEFFLELSEIYGGTIQVGERNYTKEELKNKLNQINFDLSVARQNTHLKLIKPEVKMNEDQVFKEEFYQKIQKWQKKTKIMNQEVSVIRTEFERFIEKELRPVDRTILYNELFLTVGGHLTDDGLRMLVRLETWAFEK